MKKCTFDELYDMIQEGEDWGKAVIVYKNGDYWNREYDEKSRSYVVSSSNKRFHPRMISNSLHGDCLDGKDIGVRLDLYDWDIDYCYILE